MSKIDIDKFICFLIENKSDARQLLEVCLKAQGLEYKDGELVEIDQPPLTEKQKAYYINGAISSDDEQCIDKSSCTSTKENNKPQTIKFNEPDEKCIELRDNKGEKVLVPREKIIERINEIRLKDSDASWSWSKQMADEMQEDIVEGTIKVKAELRKYFANNFSYLFKVDVDKMVEEYKEEESKVLLPLGFSKEAINDFSLAYKNGIEDMLKLIKEGGSNETTER